MCMICETARRARQRMEAEEKLRRQQELQQQCYAADIQRQWVPGLQAGHPHIMAALIMPPSMRLDDACAAAS